MRKPGSKGDSKPDPWASAKGWLRRRRQRVRAALAKSSKESTPENNRVTRVAKRLWSEGHQKEQDHQKVQERKRRD